MHASRAEAYRPSKRWTSHRTRAVVGADSQAASELRAHAGREGQRKFSAAPLVLMLSRADGLVELVSTAPGSFVIVV